MRRRSFRRTRSLGTVVQSFKKVLDFAGASRAAAAKIDFILVTGDETVVAGQTAPTDSKVPTGSVVKYIEIHYAVSNLVNVTVKQDICIQYTRSGQTSINPNAVGGNPQRNQVLYQRMFFVGTNQNNNPIYRFKIPSKFQRVREGDSWIFTTVGDVVHSNAMKAIYKFYR